VAGPEPYPQVKWTQEQEAAYAEGRKSAQRVSRQQGPATSSGKRRVVRTAQGARRYKVPIGSEIGSARNAGAAQAQGDKESTDRYNALVGQDPNAQAAAMKGLSDDQIQRLSRVAYSWKSSDPNVVRLRIGVANELKRRGFNVNDFGGLGPKSAPVKSVPAGPAVRTPARKLPSRPVPHSRAPKKPASAPKRYSAVQARRNDHKLTELSVPKLRKALGAFSKMPPGKREVVARFLVNQAIELGVPHMLGRSVVEASGQAERVLELAGKWKHGWIPLDGTAMRAKLKGGNGKPWWEGGKQRRVGSANTSRRSMEAARIVRERKAARKAGVAAPAAKKPPPFIAVPKKGGTRKVAVSDVVEYKGGPVVPGTRRIHGEGGSRKDFVSNEDTKNRFAAKKRVPIKRTSVVKSSPKSERGSKMTHTATGSGAGGEKTKLDRAIQAEGFRGEVTSSRTAPDQSKIAPQFRTGAVKPAAPAKIDSRHEGATMSDREFAKLQMQRDEPSTHSVVKRRLTQQINAEIARRKGTTPPADAEVPQHIKMAGDRKLTQLIRTNSPNAEHAKTEMASRKAHRAKQAVKSTPGKA
jgi:hypothetical protein